MALDRINISSNADTLAAGGMKINAAIDYAENHAADHKTGGIQALSPSDIGAAASGHGHTLASLGAAASSHTHLPSDIGAVPTPAAGTDGQVLAKSGSTVIWTTVVTSNQWGAL